MTDPELSPIKRALLEIRQLRARVAMLEAEPAKQVEPIAIVGMGLRMPGADDAESMAALLWSATDAVGPIPPERWDLGALYHPDPDMPGRMLTRYGAFLDGVDLFDAAFFGISPREAASMDPQQRLLLEVGWHALEDAGYAARLDGSRTGVYLGLSNSDYGRTLFNRPELIDAYAASGNAFSVAAGRISYALGLRGASMAVDTACSSSLVALHLACQALRAGECDMALAGGSNLVLAPELNISFTKARMMAPDGRCKTFDAAADGYVRGEGVGIVVLKRLADAMAAGDRVLAVVRGSAVNQDGSSNGLTAPNGPAQEAVIRAALAQGGVAAADVSFVETHGTGTSLGDPIEVGAIAAVYGPGRDAATPLWLGSIKTNIGHLEAAAGIAGVIKVVLALERGEIPPNLHFHTGNPHIDWEELPIAVPTAVTPWAPVAGRRLAGVSSFGFAGTNAHVVLGEAPRGATASDVSGRAALPKTLFRRQRYWMDPPASRPEPWALVLRRLDRQADRGPVDLDATTYPAIWASLERLTFGHIVAILRRGGVFAAAGEVRRVDDVLAACGIVGAHRRLVTSWLNRLAGKGILTQDAVGYVAPAPLAAPDLPTLWADSESRLAGNLPLLAYVKNCGALLDQVLSGKISPLETLFPGGSFKLAGDLYERSATMRYINMLAAEALAAFGDGAGRPLHIMEVGAGSGATTAALLPVREPDGSYVFTDVSPVFLQTAATRFLGTPGLSFRLFDVDRDPYEQGFADGAFDIILAANAIHASVDLPCALARLRRLLAPGGALILVESTTDFTWFDMTTGLIEGWQHGTDAARQGKTLLSPPEWLSTLLGAGFAETRAWPEGNSPAAVLGQHLVIGYVPGAAGALPIAHQTELSVAPVSHAAVEERTTPLQERITAALPDERIDLLRRFVREQVMRVLRRREDDPPGLGDRLMDIGVDSLMAVQLRGQLGAGLGLSLPVTVMFDHPTIAALADMLASLLAGPSQVDVPQTEKMSAAPTVIDEAAVAALSEAQIEALVLARMQDAAA